MEGLKVSVVQEVVMVAWVATAWANSVRVAEAVVVMVSAVAKVESVAVRGRVAAEHRLVTRVLQVTGQIK